MRGFLFIGWGQTSVHKERHFMAVWALHIRFSTFELADVVGRVGIFFRAFKGCMSFAAVGGILDFMDEFAVVVD